MSERRYVFRAVADNGQTTTRTIEASTRADAMSRAMQISTDKSNAGSPCGPLANTMRI